jgi:hypothetical protein
MDPSTDPHDGAADRLGRDSPAAIVEPSAAATAALPLPKSGQKWRHYRLSSQIPGGPGRCFNAIDTDEHVGVVIRVTPVDLVTEARRSTWTLLKNLRQPWMAELIEAQEEDGLRYEVSRIPLPVTLREWRAQRQVGLPEFEALVRQLASIVQALHACGVVHLNLRPDTLHLTSSEGALQVNLGGLEYATLIDQPHPFAVAVDLLYAPPEAVGLEMQTPGRTLCAWDWWTVGRVVQEFVLGRHVYGELLQCDLSHGVGDSRAEAEALLSEAGDYGVRAGAVELMPGMYDTQNSLLRGLLASTRPGRWGFREVQRWLEHRPVKDRYENLRDERFFVRPDDIYTITEVAEFFSQEVNWAEGEANLFNPDEPGTFAHFVASEVGNYDLYARLKGLFDLGKIPEWRELPETATQSALAAIGWAAMAGPKIGLRVRGRRIAHHELLTLVRGEGDSPALGRALLAPPYLHELQQVDPEAASLLSEVAGRHAAVLAEAVQHGWVTAGDQVALNRLLALCLESPNVLADALRRLRSNYVCTRDPAAQEMLADVSSDRNAQILLAYAELCPDRFGFVTQETLDYESYQKLRQESQRVAAALFWLRLRRALESNPMVFGSWSTLAAGWLGLAAFAWLAGFFSGAQVAIALLLAIPPILRLVHWGGVGRLAGVFAPNARPWRWRDGIARCRSEVSAELPGAVVPTGEEIAQQLAELNWKITEIPLKTPPQLVSPCSRLPGLWTTSIICWLILAVVFASATRAGIKRVRENGWRFAWQGLQVAAPDAGASVPSPNTDWSFGDPRRKRIAWDIPPPATMPPVHVDKVIVATPDQVAYALVEGEKELLAYLRHTVQPLIAIRVPTGTGMGFILFDSRDATVSERRVYMVSQMPPLRSWFQLGKYQAVYLGPSTPEVESAPVETPEALPGAL